MISLPEVYHIFEAMVPLYVAMILAYVSVKWWKLFTPDQCSGINKFVAKFSIPLLSFRVISTTNPYNMNLKLIFSDFLQKIFALFILTVTNKLSAKGSLDHVITGFSLSTLPNTLIIGIPLLGAMYGKQASTLIAQIVALQSIVWYNLLLLLFEFRAAKAVSMTNPFEDTEELEAPEGGQPKCSQDELKSKTQGIKAMLLLRMVGRKLIKNPNTHATMVGLIWAFVSYRWGLRLPRIVDNSISILSNGGLGMAMFSLGLFMASQASIIACGTRLAALAMGMKFLVGPALMTVASFAIGLRGKLLRIAIVQAALPQGIVPFVFAKEYNVHPDILSTGVIFGMLITMPIALAYYFLLEL